MLFVGEVFCGQAPVPRDRQRNLQPGKPERIGDFTVTALPVDHSIFGAVAFLIEAAGHRVLYSGDLRLHGRKPGMTRSLVEAATAALLDLLLIEGAHLSRCVDATATTEWELESHISELISGTPALTLAFFSPQHLDRLVTFYKATRHAGRTLVIDLYAAFVTHLLCSEAAIPDPACGAASPVCPAAAPVSGPATPASAPATPVWGSAMVGLQNKAVAAAQGEERAAAQQQRGAGGLGDGLDEKGVVAALGSLAGERARGVAGEVGVAGIVHGHPTIGIDIA